MILFAIVFLLTFDTSSFPGKCLDHIYTKKSSIPSAGIGAFARRFILEGSVIIFSPMLVTYGAEVLRTRPDLDDINPKQLVYNYQYSHPNSSAYFFPINTAIAINHQSTRQDTIYNPYSPNAALRWSTSERKSRYYLQRHLDDLKREHYATIVIEFVATRDINPEEEIFIDYGVEWETAWDDHVKRFAPDSNSVAWFRRNKEEPQRIMSSKSVHAMNHDKFNHKYHEWSEDHFAVCHHAGLPTDTESRIILPNTHASFRDIQYNDEGFEIVNTYTKTSSWLPCKILRADEKDSIFDVVFFSSGEGDVDTSAESRFLRRKKDLPMSHIKFITKPYKGDSLWSKAFRHPIKIPEEIFPPLWMDLS